MIFTNVLIPGWKPSNSSANLFEEDEEDLLSIEFPDPVSEDLVCICDINILLTKGCKCGAMQQELNQQSLDQA